MLHGLAGIFGRRLARAVGAGCRAAHLRAVGEHSGEALAVLLAEFGDGELLAVERNGRLYDGLADVHGVLYAEYRRIVGLYKYGAVQSVEQQVVVRKVDFRAEIVAEAHLGHSLGHASAANGPCGAYLAFVNGLVHGFEHAGHAFGVWHTVGAYARADQVQRVERLLEFRAHGLGGVERGDCKGYQCRGHVQVSEGTAHGVLAADGGETEFLLHAERA